MNLILNMTPHMDFFCFFAITPSHMGENNPNIEKLSNLQQEEVTKTTIKISA